MAKRDLFEAFNDCIDRMNAGERIDDCLRDYPDLAPRLRPLLETGNLVYRAQQFEAESAADQEQVYGVVVEAMRRKSKRASEPRRRGWLIPLAAAASLVIVLAFASLTLLGPATGNVFSNIVNALGSGESGDINEIAALASPTPVIAMAATIPALDTTAAAATMILGLATPAPSATPLPTMNLGGISPGDAELTATGLDLLLMSPTPTIPMTPAGGYVPTSVALMSPVPLSATPSPNVIAVLASSTPTGTATTTPLPTMNAAVTQSPAQSAPTPLPEIQIIPLQAGEIDDNAKWDDYLMYRRNYLQQYGYSVRDVDVTGRQIITVSDVQGFPVLGAQVQVYAGQTLVSDSRTYATGQTLFFPNARPESRGQQSYHVVVTQGNVSGEFTLDPQRGPRWNVTLQNAAPLQTIKLDVLFLLDSTGSMSDEIAQLQNNILGISEQIHALPGSIDVRYGLVTYRDRGDEYVTRSFDFTPDVTAFQSSLNTVRADGGGDTPESLNEALYNAVQNVSWRGDDTVKLIFLVADAAPHLDYPNDYDYTQEMAAAAQRGIKIHPVASSGLEPDGEFIFRQIAQYTMGHFIFLTYEQGASGAPGEARPDLHVGEPSNPAQQQSGDYTVQQLDKLVLRLIQDELAALRRSVETSQGMGVALSLAALPPAAGSTPRSGRPPAPSGGPEPFLLAVVPLLLVIVGASMTLGYLLRSRRPRDKPKRKNSERYVTLASLANGEWRGEE